ncbi:unnamed protein product [Owenia fusiformis]|uniref:Uncharacterized protein n=1 Tax=Owenia fusiformis TaxID=6347 RepID=A0A8S4PUM5_OWEFU|nr:unnamed protein product [Owenia fusiformis]
MNIFRAKFLIIFIIIIVIGTLYLLSIAPRLVQELKESTSLAAQIKWENTGVKPEIELFPPPPKAHVDTKGNFGAVKTSGMNQASRENPKTSEKIMLKEHFEQIINAWGNITTNQQKYTVLDFQNICDTHSDDLILLQIEHMYDLAGINTSQRFNNKSLKFMSNILGPRLYNSKRFEYNIQWSYDSFRHNVYMKILETFLGKPTYGGSSFRILVQGVHSFMCNVKDNFNGIYHVCCPFVPPCSNITVALVYTSYGAFLDIPTIRPFSLILAQIKNCRLNNGDQLPHEQFETDMINKVQCVRDPRFLSKHGRWILHDGSLKWGLHSKCISKMLTPTELRTCFQKLRNINCYGDSHLLNTMTYFKHLIENKSVYNETLRNWTFDNNHLYFHWSTSVREVSQNLLKDYNPTLQNIKPAVDQTGDQRYSTIIFDNGAWDMYKGTLSDYLNSIQTLLVPLLRKYRQNPTWSNTRIIWFGNPAWPHKPNYMTQGHHERNDFRIAVANALTESLTKDLGVDFINQLTPSSIRSSENVCTIHYICTKKVKHTHKSIGHVGIVIAHMLFENMCRI